MAMVLPLSHLEVQSSDDSWLLLVDGRPVDVAGHLSARYTEWTRNCRRVQDLSGAEPVHAQALRVIQQHSPPDSRSAQLVHLSQQDHWLLAQVRFSGLQDAVVMLQASGQGLSIPEGAVWSGATHPHLPEPLIRRYLRSRVPAAPAELTDCLVYRL